MSTTMRPIEVAPDGTTGVIQSGSRVVTGRECGTCTLCCKVAAVKEVDKPNGVWCPHCVAGRGPRSMTGGPPVAAASTCQWMLEKGLGPEWKPERAKFALVKSEGGRRLTALVDPGFPSAWRRAPYYENLKQWAVEAAPESTRGLSGRRPQWSAQHRHPARSRRGNRGRRARRSAPSRIQDHGDGAGNRRLQDQAHNRRGLTAG